MITRERPGSGALTRVIESVLGTITLAVALSVIAAALADEFEERKQRQIARCRAISPEAYSTGLIFNPSGHATVFHRSRCFQGLAVDERDRSLCGEVKERKSWFFDGSEVSERSCLQRVAKRITQDQNEAKAKDFASIHKLESIHFFKNGNGKDFDLKVVSEGAFAGTYELEVRLAQPGRAEAISIHQRTYGYAANDTTRWILLRHGELAERLGDAFADGELKVLVTLRLARTTYNRFYYDLIPARFASSQLTTSVKLASLPPRTSRSP